MVELSHIQRNPQDTMTEQRMRALEEIAAEAISKVTSARLMGFANRVERYYPMATRQEDLLELP
jgi:hypothetical protein